MFAQPNFLAADCFSISMSQIPALAQQELDQNVDKLEQIVSEIMDNGEDKRNWGIVVGIGSSELIATNSLKRRRWFLGAGLGEIRGLEDQEASEIDVEHGKGRVGSSEGMQAGKGREAVRKDWSEGEGGGGREAMDEESDQRGRDGRRERPEVGGAPGTMVGEGWRRGEMRDDGGEAGEQGSSGVEEALERRGGGVEHGRRNEDGGEAWREVRGQVSIAQPDSRRQEVVGEGEAAAGRGRLVSEVGGLASGGGEGQREARAYDVSLSQVDPSVMAELPLAIR